MWFSTHKINMHFMFMMRKNHLPNATHIAIGPIRPHTHYSYYNVDLDSSSRNPGPRNKASNPKYLLAISGGIFPFFFFFFF